MVNHVLKHDFPQSLQLYVYEWRTKLLSTRNGHGQSGPIACEGLYFHPMCENRVSVSGWSPIGCEGFGTNLIKFEHPKSTPYYFTFPLILAVTHVIPW